MSLNLHAPGSKSMTQRALVIAALAEGPVRVPGALDCDDSRRLIGLLTSLGCRVEPWDSTVQSFGTAAVDSDQPKASDPQQREERERTPAEKTEPGAENTGITGAGSLTSSGWRVHPASLRSDGASIDCGNAGTTVRFGACLALLCEGPLLLDGDERMRQRPIGGLARALRQLGIEVEFLGQPDCPPLRLRRVAAPGPEVTVDCSLSSQFASGLLLVAPRLPGGLLLHLEGETVSIPYLKMTTEMMRRAGARIEWQSDRSIRVLPGGYARDLSEIPVEVDWSSAAFLLAAGAVKGLTVKVPGLVPDGQSLQGDAAFAGFLEKLRQEKPQEFDLTDVPDLIAPLAAVALLASHPTRIRGAAHTRVKESDRIAVLAGELKKLGADVEEHPDGLTLQPMGRRMATQLEMDPAGDHRMAMAFGVLSLRYPTIRTQQPQCVDKSFPGFWGQLDQIRQAAAGPVLVGLRGAGKTTVGPLLAEALRLQFVDADAELERRTGQTIPQLVAAGMQSFRRQERELLLELLGRPGLVVATGGGAVLHQDVRWVLRQRLTTWLKAPHHVLAKRIQGTDRPSLTGRPIEDELVSQYHERQAYYGAVSTMEVDTSYLTPRDVALSIAGFWVQAQKWR